MSPRCPWEGHRVSVQGTTGSSMDGRPVWGQSGDTAHLSGATAGLGGPKGMGAPLPVPQCHPICWCPAPPLLEGTEML